MKKSTLAIILTVIALVVATIVVVMSSKDKTETSVATNASSNQQSTATQDNSNTNESSTNSKPAKTYSPDQVAEHNSASSCWTIIDDAVYDITAYVSRHPGGNEIIKACGTDGSTLFNQRTSSSGEKIGSGTPHSESAKSQLNQYQIGTLAQN